MAQNNQLNQVCTVNFDSVPLPNVLVKLHDAYNLEFSYSPSIMPDDAYVVYACTNCQLDQVLQHILHPYNIEFQLVGQHIVLVQSQSKLNQKVIKEVKKYTISGYIVDESNEEALIGAAVFNAESGIGTISNQYGYYCLTLPKGKYKLISSYVGYEKSEKSLELNKDIVWHIKLGFMQTQMKEITVNSVTTDSIKLNLYAGQTNFSLRQMINKSNSLGINDLLKSLENEPGLNFHGDGSSYFYVRGGNRDQNLILLDEAPIYNPSHVFGLFTPITTEVVKKTTVYKADFPVQQGGRLSSLIDIRTRDGNMEHFAGMASIGIYNGLINFEGPFKKEKSSYFISYRRSYIGALLKKAQANIQDFYFDDLTAKLNFRLGEKDRLFLTAYVGNDKFLNKSNGLINGLEWMNQSFTARWNHIFGPKLFANTTFYTSKYDYKLHTDYSNQIYWNSHISSSHLKSDFTYFHNPKNKISFGSSLNAYFFNPGNYTAPEISRRNIVSQVNSGEFTLYIGNQQQLNNRIYLSYGTRLSNWSNYGEAFVVNFDNAINSDYVSYAQGERFYSHVYFEPRFSLTYKINKNGYISTSFNRTSQQINLINNSISPFNSLEVWLPAGPNIKPQKADIVNIGIKQSFKDQKYEIKGDLYYKLMQNQIGFKYHAQTVLNPLIEGELRQGIGFAYGIELMLSKNYGKLYGEISYAYSRSFLQIDGLNKGNPYPATQDKPLNLTLNMNYQLNPKWLMTLNIILQSGNVITTPTSFYKYRGYQVPIYTAQNNQRLPDYKRVDISSDFLLNEPGQKTEHHLIFSIYNLFNSKNYAFLYFNKVAQDASYVVPTDQLNPQSYVPTYRYVFSIIPSLTYKMNF